MSAVGEVVELGSGTTLPALGLGTWELSGSDATDSIAHAVKLGYRLIDTAVDYGSEQHIREALERDDIDREALYLEHKVEEDEEAYEATRDRTEALAVEQLDLCILHRPPPEGAGEQLWEGLIRAREDGLAREVGVSNYAPEQIEALIDASGEAPAVNQIEWSPFGFSHEVLEHARDRGIVVQAYSPLTRGERLDETILAEIAGEVGKSPAQVMLRWALQQGVAVVPKAASPAHRRENIAVFDFELAHEQMQRVSELNEHYSALGGLQYL